MCGHRSPSQHLSRSDPCRPYRRIGVRPFINCCGTRTIHSGTLVLPEVRRAMDAASRFFVNIDELMEAVGRRVADLTGAGHAIVTSGAAAALTHATAGCVTGGDPEKALRLPDVRGMKDRVVMIGGGRFTYDHAIRAVGARVVEVGSAAELERALDGRAAMIALLGTHLPGSPVSLETAAALAGARGVPIVVDAASEHLMRPDPYLAAGASLVCYSGGKYLRGPQSSGLLLGEERWVRAAWLNAAPHHALGRGMKVGKEEVMGLLAAVERWAAHCDPEADRRRWEADLRRIADAVGELDGVTAELLRPETDRAPVPHLEIRWDNARIPIGGLGLRERLLAGEPRIMLDDRGATEGSLLVDPFSLQPGDARIVGRKIHEALAGSASPRPAKPRAGEQRPAAPLPVAGRWEVEITHPAGVSRHALTLEQSGLSLSGRHRTESLESPIAGALDGNRIALRSSHPYEGTHLAYSFEGTVEAGRMHGRVDMGTSGRAAPGPLNRREFGTASWTACRRGG